jgi:hypothetical protein
MRFKKKNLPIRCSVKSSTTYTRPLILQFNFWGQNRPNSERSNLDAAKIIFISINDEFFFLPDMIILYGNKIHQNMQREKLYNLHMGSLFYISTLCFQYSKERRISLLFIIVTHLYSCDLLLCNWYVPISRVKNFSRNTHRLIYN